MERIAGDVETGHVCIRNLHALLIGIGVDRALDLEPGLGCCRADQFDHSEAIG